MLKFVGIAALCSAFALPAMAQITPISPDATPKQTNLNPAAAQMEIRNSQRADLQAVTPEQALQNALRRCDPLPEFYKEDCISRVKGGGQAVGSVTGGGILMRSVTEVPVDQLKAEEKNIGPVNLPRRERARQHRPSQRR